MQRDLLYFKRDFIDRHFRASFEVCDTLWFDNDVIKNGNAKHSDGKEAELLVLVKRFPRRTSTVE